MKNNSSLLLLLLLLLLVVLIYKHKIEPNCAALQASTTNLVFFIIFLLICFKNRILQSQIAILTRKTAIRFFPQIGQPYYICIPLGIWTSCLEVCSCQALRVSQGSIPKKVRNQGNHLREPDQCLIRSLSATRHQKMTWFQ